MISHFAHAHCSVARGLNTRAHISLHSPRVFILDSGTTDPALSTYILRAERLNSTVAHFSPHTRPPNMQARLANQKTLTACLIFADICGLVTVSVPGEHLQSHTAGQALTLPVLDQTTVTCLTTRMTLRLLVVLSAVENAALPTAMPTVIVPDENPIFHLLMPNLNHAKSSGLDDIV